MANTSNLGNCLTILMFLLAAAGFTQAGTITVGPAGGCNFGTIQAGIDAAIDGDTVLVAPGEYVVTEPITFRGKAITILSEAGPDQTTIRMGTPTDPDRASVVIFENNETTDSVLEGFTITGGRGLPGNSEKTWGGGIFFRASSGTVRNCAIVQNTPEGSGGGVMVYSGSSATFIGCTISENTSPGEGSGAGVCCHQNSSLTMTDCAITENSAGLSAGGVYCGTNSSMTMTNCIVRGNSSLASTPSGGGGVCCYEDSSLTMTDCIIAENFAGYSGGAAYCGMNSSTTFTGCTISENSSARYAPGVMSRDSASVTLSNSIIWGNAAPEILVGVAGTFNVMYSNVASGKAGIPIYGTLNWGEGNIDADPLFACIGYLDDNGTHDSSDDVWVASDYHLKSEAGRWDPLSECWVIDDVTSPCIDAGDPNHPIGGELIPNGGRINMGAYGGTREASMSTAPQPAPKPVAHWRLDETEGEMAYDSVSGNYDIVMGGALWQPTGGKVDGALELDGIDDYIITPTGPNPTDGPFSVVAWIKGGVPGQVIISQPLASNWLMVDAEGKLMTELKASGNAPATLLSQTVITDGQWHLIGLMWDGLQRMLCVDGLVVAEDTLDGLEASAGGLNIGVGNNYAAGTFFSGLIDDIRLYNRVVSP